MLQKMRCFECIDTKSHMMGNTWMICCKTDFAIGNLASVLCFKRFFPMSNFKTRNFEVGSGTCML